MKQQESYEMEEANRDRVFTGFAAASSTASKSLRLGTGILWPLRVFCVFFSVTM